MEIILKYFPSINRQQIDKFSQMDELYHFWNERINLMSRKDIDHLYERHILHSLSIARFHLFEKGLTIMDLGTGGGFPGMPLAIIFPQTQFILVDSIRKKIKVVEEISAKLELSNVIVIHSRAEELNEKFHFVVTRAVTSLPKLNAWIKSGFYKDSPASIANGLIALKGGNLKAETASFGSRCQTIALSEYYEEEFFKSKKIVYLKA
ncbi:MAG: 16S rRNA (guanine(527)-N(7))-methyltransferase RsmG [Bacteroidales bacterium]|nr:16S rRNA (guanine(527)-N(7))-methyltransferase RsmG [Bacteroidales bacterium]